jgi:hypothetical protein
MRYRLMATYRGVPYEAGIGPADSDIVLFAACPPPEDLGFQPATGHWRKAVSRAEVDAVWESRPSGTFGGEPCLVLDDLGDQLHIGYLGHDPFQAERLGYCQVEPGVFEVLVAHEDVTGIAEELLECPYPLARRPPAPAWPPAPGWGPEPPRAPEPGWAPPPDRTPEPVWPAPTADAATLAPPSFGPSSLPPPSFASPQAAVPSPAVSPRANPTPADLTPRRRRGGRASGPAWAQIRQTFAELADRATIPRESYALDEEVDGAFCLLRTERGFEVFNSVERTRQEVRVFDDEETAYFYLFGLLVAEAVRDGRLVPPPSW